MSTTYYPAMPAYDGHAMRGYPPSALAHVGRSKALMDEARSSQHFRGPSQQAQAGHIFHARNGSVSTTPLREEVSRRPTRPSTPAGEAVSTVNQSSEASPRGSESLIYHSLQIPKCISPDGGNLSNFAANMTCLFWFDAADNLKRAETIRTRPLNAPIPRLPNLVKPLDQFRKWVHNVLSTTQVTQNVIILALLFIYRLKMSTPQIKGRAGSEYRLLTVALMLGNKFLDDNTYTNKTWAEVSCFTVQEIHVMEVEFLGNMRYNLLASQDEWELWLAKLASFHEYYERARSLPAPQIRHPSPSNPSNHSFGSSRGCSPMLSPTTTLVAGIPDAGTYTPSALSTASPSSCMSMALPAHHANPNSTSPLSVKPSFDPLAATRKRSPDHDPADHPAKRQIMSRSGHATPTPAKHTRPHYPTDGARLPVPPPLSIVTNNSRGPPGAYPVVNGYSSQMAGPSPHAVSLPPLSSSTRPLSTVYPPPPSQPTSLTPQVPNMAATSSARTPVPTTSFHMTSLAGGPGNLSYGTPTKHRSPGSLAPFVSSPMMEHVGSGSVGVHTPIPHTPMTSSPSVYLQHRASPYKPIRHVNTLLYPPPSASLDQYHLSVVVPPSQMHYQPLGRRHDVRTGLVPEYVVYHRDQQNRTSHGGPR